MCSFRALIPKTCYPPWLKWTHTHTLAGMHIDYRTKIGISIQQEQGRGQEFFQRRAQDWALRFPMVSVAAQSRFFGRFDVGAKKFRGLRVGKALSCQWCLPTPLSKNAWCTAINILLRSEQSPKHRTQCASVPHCHLVLSWAIVTQATEQTTMCDIASESIGDLSRMLFEQDCGNDQIWWGLIKWW